MKLLIPISRPPLSAVAFPLLVAFALLATTSCGHKMPWGKNNEPAWESSHRMLETEIKTLKAEIEGEHLQAERANFWRIISVALVAIVLFALVGGAALGSRARHERFLFREEDNCDQSLRDEIV